MEKTAIDTQTRRIPVNEPRLDGRELDYVTECIRSGWISSDGPFVSRFEQEFASYLGCDYGVAVSSGTAALDLAVAAAGVGPGDEVIMPTFTIISCALPIIRAGATPVLVDSDEATWNMDVAQLARRITPRTKAIMVVHIYGLPVDMGPVLRLAEQHNLFVIEDAAEAHGQRYHGRMCGTMGDVGIFSFYANKNVTCGEGGMLVTNNRAIAEQTAARRNLCFEPRQRFVHEELGWNYRMTNLQAAVGVAQLEKIDTTLQRKQAVGRLYTDLLNDESTLRLPVEALSYAANHYWVYGVVLREHAGMTAATLAERLAERGVATRPFFWPMHEQPVFLRRNLFAEEAYPTAEYLARYGLYLPSGVALTDDDIRYVAAAVKHVIHFTV